MKGWKDCTVCQGTGEVRDDQTGMLQAKCNVTPPPTQAQREADRRRILALKIKRTFQACREGDEDVRAYAMEIDLAVDEFVSYVERRVWETCVRVLRECPTMKNVRPSFYDELADFLANHPERPK